MNTEIRLMILSGLCGLLMLAGYFTGHDLRHVALNICDAGCWTIFPRVKGLRSLTVTPIA